MLATPWRGSSCLCAFGTFLTFASLRLCARIFFSCSSCPSWLILLQGRLIRFLLYALLRKCCVSFNEPLANAGFARNPSKISKTYHGDTEIKQETRGDFVKFEPAAAGMNLTKPVCCWRKTGDLISLFSIMKKACSLEFSNNKSLLEIGFCVRQNPISSNLFFSVPPW